MIQHLVLLTLKEGVTRADPLAIAAADALTALGSTLTQPVTWRTHWCVGTRPNSADFALVCDFPDEAALESYQADPAHREVVGKLAEVFVLATADYVS